MNTILYWVIIGLWTVIHLTVSIDSRVRVTVLWLVAYLAWTLARAVGWPLTFEVALTACVLVDAAALACAFMIAYIPWAIRVTQRDE
jgi:hypothetical protein